MIPTVIGITSPYGVLRVIKQTPVPRDNHKQRQVNVKYRLAKQCHPESWCKEATRNWKLDDEFWLNLTNLASGS